MKNIKRILVLALVAVSLCAVALPALAFDYSLNSGLYTSYPENTCNARQAIYDYTLKSQSAGGTYYVSILTKLAGEYNFTVRDTDTVYLAPGATVSGIIDHNIRGTGETRNIVACKIKVVYQGYPSMQIYGNTVSHSFRAN